MHILQAKQAALFYRIPMAAHHALIADAQTGKGHVLTLILLASYLWSDEPIEGSRAEFAEALGIGVQTFEAHVPALGRAGALSYAQPHVGYYRFFGLVRSDSEAEALRRAWSQAEAEFERTGLSKRERLVWITQRVDGLKEALKFTLDEALKFTHHVVEDTSTSSLNVLEESGDQALKFTLEASKTTQPAEDASGSTLDASNSTLDGSNSALDAGMAQVVQLYEQEIGGTLTAMMLDEFNDLWAQCADVERWRYAFKASLGKRSRWAYVKAVIEHPERDTRGGNGNGRTTDNRQRGTAARGKAAGDDGGGRETVAVSHDIDAWFGKA
ncbi:MAG: hypothetical protein M0R37_11850 [Bacteroidales bacterium]|nr:hypothetical protein [Bacteroidales bacterium]